MNRAEWHALRRRFETLHTGWPTLFVGAADLSALLSAVWLSQKGPLAFLASIGILAFVLLHAYLQAHEAAHSAVSKNKWLNDAVGHVAGWLIVLPYLTRRRSHLLHHTWAGHPHGDPANRRMIQRFSVMSEKQGRALDAVWRSWIPLFALNDRVGLWRDAFAERRRGARSRPIAREISANYLYLTGYGLLACALVATGRLGAFAAWYLPALVALLFLEELVNAPHHAETPLLRPDDDALPYWEQHEVTHSCRSIPVWSRVVLLNFNLHTAHHLFPAVPWSGLPDVHHELLRVLPGLAAPAQHEVAWALQKWRVPLLELTGHYFDRIPRRSRSAG